MKYKYLMVLGVIIFSFTFLINSASAQDKTQEAAMSMLRDYLVNPTARADYTLKKPEASQAEKNLSQFPPNIQKRLEKIVLMIMQESGANASKHIDANIKSGAEGAFNSFSPAVQKEIQDLARELEKDPEFMKKAGYLK